MAEAGEFDYAAPTEMASVRAATQRHNWPAAQLVGEKNVGIDGDYWPRP